MLKHQDKKKSRPIFSAAWKTCRIGLSVFLTVCHITLNQSHLFHSLKQDFLN